MHMKHISTKKPAPTIVWPAEQIWEQKHSTSTKYMSIREHTWKDQEQNPPSSRITGKKTLCHHPDLRQGLHQKNTKTYTRTFSTKYKQITSQHQPQCVTDVTTTTQRNKVMFLYMEVNNIYW